MQREFNCKNISEENKELFNTIYNSYIAADCTESAQLSSIEDLKKIKDSIYSKIDTVRENIIVKYSLIKEYLNEVIELDDTLNGIEDIDNYSIEVGETINNYIEEINNVKMSIKDEEMILNELINSLDFIDNTLGYSILNKDK